MNDQLGMEDPSGGRVAAVSEFADLALLERIEGWAWDMSFTSSPPKSWITFEERHKKKGRHISGDPNILDGEDSRLFGYQPKLLASLPRLGPTLARTMGAQWMCNSLVPRATAWAVSQLARLVLRTHGFVEQSICPLSRARPIHLPHHP